jgi:DNA-binding NarL/FixJ family response regulator
MTPPIVLIFDDSPLILSSTQAALEMAGIAVLTAINLGELQEALARARPDIVLIDVNMPEAFGDDVAMVLRGVKSLTVPIYLYSNLDEAELAQRAEAAAVEGYISKRGGLPAVVDRVREILDARDA